MEACSLGIVFLHLDCILNPCTFACEQALVLAPTREIALQTADVISTLARFLPPPGLKVGVFIGGLPVEDDQKALRRCAEPTQQACVLDTSLEEMRCQLQMASTSNCKAG